MTEIPEHEMREIWQQAREAFLEERNVRNPCEECAGTGIKTYANTATWHDHGIAGQAFTPDVCDKCWGSGRADLAWPSHRIFYRMLDKLRKLEDEKNG